MKKIDYRSIPRKLHLIITGEEGSGLTFVIRRESVPLVLGVTFLTLTLLSVGTWMGMGWLRQRNMFSTQVMELSNELTDLRGALDRRVDEKIAAKETAWQEKIEQLSASLAFQSTAIEKLWEERREIVSQYEERIAAIDQTQVIKIADIRTEYEEEIFEINQGYQQEVAELKQDKQELLEKTVTRLDERSRVIESMMSRIGVDLKIHDETENSGGPFIAIDEHYSERLLSRSDQYIDTIKKIPLGYPVNGKITSGFGRRRDPFNNQPSFHSGIDFKGRVGSKIEATADGKVVDSGYDSGYGQYVLVAHGNGYETMFAHLSKRLLTKGAKVKRGDIVGLMGNTGRSTGPHLHYEVRVNGKAVNPRKFLSVARLSFTVLQ